MRWAESGKLESGEQKMENINQIYNILLNLDFKFGSLEYSVKIHTNIPFLANFGDL
jgi:hypothetical protein